jgi:hypothetical protein
VALLMPVTVANGVVRLSNAVLSNFATGAVLVACHIGDERPPAGGRMEVV